MNSKALSRLATVKAYTKRRPDAEGGKVGPAEAYLSAFYIVPLQPLDSDMRMRYPLETPYALLKTLVAGDLDIRPDDVLVLIDGDRELDVRFVEPWHIRGDVERLLILEEQH